MSQEDIDALVARLREATAAGPRADAEADELMRYEAVIATIDRLEQTMARTPWDVIPPAWLDGVQSAYGPSADLVEAHAATDPAETAFPVEWAHIQTMFGSLNPFLAAVVPESSSVEDVAAFRGRSSELVAELRGQVAEARGEVDRVAAELAEVESARDAALETIRTQQQSLEATIAEQAARLDQAIRENQEQFSASQDRHRSEVTDLLAEQRSSLDTALTEIKVESEVSVNAAEETATAASARIEALEKKALKSYNTIGNASVAGHFQSDANAQGKQANLWRWLAVVGFAVVAVATVVELFASNGSLRWEQTRSRIPAILALGGFATFAVTEARSHRKAERESRLREVELSSLDPILVLISDTTAAEKVKLDYVRARFIGPGDDESQPADVVAPPE